MNAEFPTLYVCHRDNGGLRVHPFPPSPRLESRTAPAAAAVS